MTVELRSRANRDSLTGQFNHTTLERHLSDQLRLAPEKPFALLAVDVGNFRLLNETHGHAVGDAVLRWLGRACHAAVGPHDSVARYAADQFVVLLRDADDRHAGECVAKICAAVDEFSGTEVGASDFPLSVSVGVARYPDHGRSPDALLARADIEVYRARFGVRSLDDEHDAVEPSAQLGEGFEALEGLVAAVDAKDDYTMRHSELVAEFAVLLAATYGLSDDTRQLIRIGGLVHDVGKIAVPDSILKKPGRLTPDELQTLRGHVELSATLVRSASVRFSTASRTITSVGTARAIQAG